MQIVKDMLNKLMDNMDLIPENRTGNFVAHSNNGKVVLPKERETWRRIAGTGASYAKVRVISENLWEVEFLDDSKTIIQMQPSELQSEFEKAY